MDNGGLMVTFGSQPAVGTDPFATKLAPKGTWTRSYQDYMRQFAKAEEYVDPFTGVRVESEFAAYDPWTPAERAEAKKLSLDWVLTGQNKPTKRLLTIGLTKEAKKRLDQGYFLRTLLPAPPEEMVLKSVINNTLLEDQPKDFEDITDEYMNERIKSLEKEYNPLREGPGRVSNQDLSIALFEGYTTTMKPIDDILDKAINHLKEDWKGFVDEFEKAIGLKESHTSSMFSKYTGEEYPTYVRQGRSIPATTPLWGDVAFAVKVGRTDAVRKPGKFINYGLKFAGERAETGLKAIINIGDPRAWGPTISIIPGRLPSDIIPFEGITPWVTSMEKIQVAEQIRRTPTGPQAGIQAANRFLSPWVSWLGVGG